LRKYTLNEVKALITQMGKVGGNTLIEDEAGNLYDFDKVIEESEKRGQKCKNNLNVNFRWNEYELNRIKAVAEKKGMPYQAYIKLVLKQTVDREENKK